MELHAKFSQSFRSRNCKISLKKFQIGVVIRICTKIKWLVAGETLHHARRKKNPKNSWTTFGVVGKIRIMPYPAMGKIILNNFYIRTVIRIITKVKSFVASSTSHHSRKFIKFVNNCLSYAADRQRQKHNLRTTHRFHHSLPYKMTGKSSNTISTRVLRVADSSAVSYLRIRYRFGCQLRRYLSIHFRRLL